MSKHATETAVRAVLCTDIGGWPVFLLAVGASTICPVSLSGLVHGASI